MINQIKTVDDIDDLMMQGGKCPNCKSDDIDVRWFSEVNGAGYDCCKCNCKWDIFCDNFMVIDNEIIIINKEKIPIKDILSISVIENVGNQDEYKIFAFEMAEYVTINFSNKYGVITYIDNFDKIFERIIEIAAKHSIYLSHIKH